MVRSVRLQSILHRGRDRLFHGRDAIEGICGGGMVCRPLARYRLGHLFRPLHPYAGAPQGASHLRRQLVLLGLHRGRGDPTHHQQSYGSGLPRPCQELHDLAGRAGLDGAVVVRAQCGRLLPDGRLPGDALLLPAETSRAAHLFLPAFDPQLLGHNLFLHVGRLPPPSLHGPAALGTEPRNDVLGNAAGSLMGIGRQRPADAERRMAQGS